MKLPVFSVLRKIYRELNSDEVPSEEKETLPEKKVTVPIYLSFKLSLTKRNDADMAIISPFVQWFVRRLEDKIENTLHEKGIGVSGEEAEDRVREGKPAKEPFVGEVTLDLKPIKIPSIVKVEDVVIRFEVKDDDIASTETFIENELWDIMREVSKTIILFLKESPPNKEVSLKIENVPVEEIDKRIHAFLHGDETSARR